MATTAAKKSVTAAVLGACATLKRLVKTLEERTRSENRRLLQLRSTLGKLESQTNPDKARIKMLRAEIATLDKQLDKDTADLLELKDVVRESCG